MSELIYDIIGFIGVACTSVALIPQAVQVYRTRKTEDLSLIMLLIFFIGQCCWFVYGTLNGTLQVMMSASIQTLLTLYILIMKIKLG